MNKTPLFIIFFIFSEVIFAQSNQLLVNKIAKEICSCIKENNEIKNTKQTYDRCFELKLKNMKDFLSKKEVKYYNEDNHSEAINRGLFLAVNQTCTIFATNSKQNSIANKSEFPTNINKDNFNTLELMIHQFVAFEGVVKKVKKKNNRLYSKVYVGEQFIWVESMIVSSFEKENNKLKFLGKVTESNSTTNKGGLNYHISAYGIVDMATNNFMYYPGFENKMNTWRSGTIPLTSN